MLYHVIVTGKCNLRCRYCGGDWPGKPGEIDVSLLKRFISRDPEAGISFYGGEPLLALDLVERIMDEVPARYWHLQTNALLLHELPDEYLHRLDTILTSVDGDKNVTNHYRGKGVYEAAIRNARNARERGFTRDLVARMAVSDHSSVYDDVTHLLFLEHDGRRLYDHVHWQLDVFWSAPGTWEEVDFDSWLQEYNKGVTRLAGLWLDWMRDGTVLGIAPFQGVMHTLLTGKPSGLRCGSGQDAFAIAPDGTVLACPIGPDWDFLRLGNIREKKPEQLRNTVGLVEPCTSCDILWACGGRCLFANRTKLWGEEGFKKVCQSVRHLVNVLQEIKPEVEDLIKKGRIRLGEFDYPNPNNGVEVIP